MPDPTPAAQGPEADLWTTAERERETQIGGGAPRAPTTANLAAARALLEHVQREGLDEAAAAAKVGRFLAAAARFARAKRDGGSPLYATLRAAQPFHVKAYEATAAHADLSPPPPAMSPAEAHAAWMAREFQWDDGRTPLRYDNDPEPPPLSEAAVAEMDAIVMAAFASAKVST